MLTRHRSDGLKHVLPFHGELQQVDATVVRVLEALDQTPALQLVDERDEPAGEHSEARRNLLLAGSGRGGNNAQSTHVRGCQSKWLEPLREFRRRMSSNLRQQKCG